MLVERSAPVMIVDVVGEAYDIAAHYLKKTGQIADGVLINEPLLDLVHQLFDGGVRNRLLLANRAITKFERAMR